MVTTTDSRIAVFGAVFAALYAAHQVADHWVQTQHQADHKGQPGWTGRWACVKHVLTYTGTAVLALAVLAVFCGLRLDGVQAGVGLTVSAVSHYIADRRTPLRWLCDRLGKNPLWLEKGGGLYAMDQSWHIGFLFLSAVVVAA